MLRRRTSNRDAGSSFVEILVAIVLLGTVVIGTLAALQASVVGTRVERDHAKVQQWLQAAVGVLQDVGTPFGECVTPTPAEYTAILTSYRDALRANAQRPDGFDSANQLDVVSVEVWNRSEWQPFLSQSTCIDNNQLRQQLVTIEAVNDDGSIRETVEVVKIG